MRTSTVNLEHRDRTMVVMSDIHIPHHDARACRLAIECAEDAGADTAILLGDINDCGVGSRHPEKQAQDVLEHGDLVEACAPGRWIEDWARTREAHYVLGNHEKWIAKAIKMNPILHGTATPEGLMGLPADGDGWRVYPDNTKLRIGSLVLEHGHGIFPSGAGGQNPGARVKSVAPDQVTMIGHLHRKFATYWTTPDEHGIPRTKAAFGNGHLSLTESHEDYAGSYPNWQQSFAIIRVWMDGKRPMFTVDQPEIFRDRRGRPYFEYNGKVYR